MAKLISMVVAKVAFWENILKSPRARNATAIICNTTATISFRESRGAGRCGECCWPQEDHQLVEGSFLHATGFVGRRCAGLGWSWAVRN